MHHIFGTVVCNKAILLQINKITFEKSENQEKKIHKSQNLTEILTGICFVFF